MPVMTHLIVDSDGLIVNRILLDTATTSWEPGPGLTMLPATIHGAIGGAYLNGVYTPPPEPPAEDEEEGG